MQILITVGDDGVAAAQVLGFDPGTASAPETSAGTEEAAYDGGAAPSAGETPAEEPAVSSNGMQPDAVDAGTAPFIMEETEELLAEVSPAQGGATEEAGAAITISDAFATAWEPPRLRPVD